MNQTTAPNPCPTPLRRWRALDQIEDLARHHALSSVIDGVLADRARVVQELSATRNPPPARNGEPGCRDG